MCFKRVAGDAHIPLHLFLFVLFEYKLCEWLYIFKLWKDIIVFQTFFPEDSHLDANVHHDLSTATTMLEARPCSHFPLHNFTLPIHTWAFSIVKNRHKHEPSRP